MTGLPDDALTEDAFLGGRVRVRQPAGGYRAAMDTVLLAAAIPAAAKGPILELGCGAGTASLCVAWRLNDVPIVGIDADPAMVDLARSNASLNSVGDRVQFQHATVGRDALSDFGPVSHVLANPPYLTAGSAHAPPHPARERAMVESDARLTDWLDAMLGVLRPKGGLTLVHRADRLHEIVTHLTGQAGEITVFPLWPRRGIAAKRVLVQARKGVRGGAVMAPGLVLHGDEPDERYSPEAEAVLRDGAALALR